MLLSYIMGYSRHKKHKKEKNVGPKTPKAFDKDDPTHNKSLWGGDVPFKK
jgi:hypothetical protein